MASSYIGKGTVTFAILTGGIAGTAVNVGNASKFEITNTEDVKEMMDYQNAGSGVVDSLRRITKREITILLHEFTQDNLDKAMAGTAEIEVVLDGLNDANTGHTIIATFARVKFGSAKKIDLISENWGGIELTGTILKPATGAAYQIVVTNL